MIDGAGGQPSKPRSWAASGRSGGEHGEYAACSEKVGYTKALRYLEHPRRRSHRRPSVGAAVPGGQGEGVVRSSRSSARGELSSLACAQQAGCSPSQSTTITFPARMGFPQAKCTRPVLVVPLHQEWLTAGQDVREHRHRMKASNGHCSGQHRRDLGGRTPRRHV